MKRSATSSVEKVFVHDMASQLMLATGWLDRLAIVSPSIIETTEYKKLEAQLKKISTLLTERRGQISTDDQDPD